MKIAMHQWAEETMANAEKTIFPIMTYPGLPLINKTIAEMTCSGKVQFECIRALANRFPQMPAIPMSMDLSLEAEAFGAEVIITDNEVPAIQGRVLSEYTEIVGLTIPEPSTKRINAFVDAAELLVGADFGKPVFAGSIGPYSLAGRLLDLTEILTGIFIYPDEVHQLLEKTTQFLVSYLERLKATGVNGVIMAEPAAGLLGEEQCNEFSSNYIRKIVEKVQDDTFWIILHNCGNTASLVDSMVSTGAKAYHFGNAVDMSAILPLVPEEYMVMGNLNPVGVIKLKSPAQITAEVALLRQKTCQYKNFVLSSGCDIPPGTSLENINALFC